MGQIKAETRAQCGEPKGELVILTIAMPKDTNFNGDIFGGWLVSEMDLGGAVAARQVSKSRIATIGIDGLKFRHPVQVGDTVSCYANLTKTGTTSMTFQIMAWVSAGGIDHERYCVAEGTFTYVAIDEHGQKIPVKRPGNP
jgi:acyl-CoA thioesterase YciA